MKQFITMLLIGLFAAFSSTGYAKANDLAKTDGIGFLVDVDDGVQVFLDVVIVDTGPLDSFAYLKSEGKASINLSVFDALEKVKYKQNRFTQLFKEADQYFDKHFKTPRDCLSDELSLDEQNMNGNSIYRSPRDSLTKVSIC